MTPWFIGLAVIIYLAGFFGFAFLMNKWNEDMYSTATVAFLWPVVVAMAIVIAPLWVVLTLSSLLAKGERHHLWRQVLMSLGRAKD